MARHLYLAPLPTFIADARDPGFADRLAEHLIVATSQGPSDSERTAWRNSLPALADVLAQPDLAGSQVFVELFMPLSSQRCDVLLTGRTMDGPSAVVVELKQWSYFQDSHLEEHVRIANSHRLHPSVQVRDYVDNLRAFHSAFTGEGERIQLHGVAYLHDMDPAIGQRLRLGPCQDAVKDCPLFFKRESAAFARWLAEHLIPGPGIDAAERIRTGKPAPSQKLLDLVVATIKHKHEWKLLDVQKTAYFAIRHAVQMAKDTGQKTVVIVRGGPGTGKSVIAMQLLADAARQGWAVAHATGTQAFQKVLQGITMEFAEAKLKQIHNVKTKKALPVQHLFSMFSEIARIGAAHPDTLDLTVCDEAHRLWEFRQSKYGSKVRLLSSTPMVREVIAASRVTAFFLDDNQSVRAGEIGRSSVIEEHARHMGIDVEWFELDAQFRCAGSASYIRWVEGLLGWRNVLDVGWRDSDVYTVRIWDDMSRLDGYLRSLCAQGQRCRIVAGFCWKWSDPTPLGQLNHDVRDARFGAWSAPWIEKTEQNLKATEHRYFRWATRDELYEQVGSIYSVQGFEFDAVGVVWGEDLVWRGDRWVAQLGQNKDRGFQQELRTSGEDAVGKLVNIYRVLLTRGMRETHLFVLDDETRAYLRACLEHQVPRRAVAGMVERQYSAPTNPPRDNLIALRAPSRTPPRSAAHGFPLLDLSAAAGPFGNERVDVGMIDDAEERLIWDGARPVQPGYFVARVTGKSMEPLIPDGALCLFRAATLVDAGSRPMLVRLEGQAADTGRFTVKDVSVDWGQGDEGATSCRGLTLRARNPDFPDVVIGGMELGDVRVVAELMEVVHG